MQTHLRFGALDWRCARPSQCQHTHVRLWLRTDIFNYVFVTFVVYSPLEHGIIDELNQDGVGRLSSDAQSAVYLELARPSSARSMFRTPSA